MKDFNVAHGIAKFLGKEADIHDLQELEAWLKKNHDHTLFNRFAKLDCLITFSMADYDINKGWKQRNMILKSLETATVYKQLYPMVGKWKDRLVWELKKER